VLRRLVNRLQVARAKSVRRRDGHGKPWHRCGSGRSHDFRPVVSRMCAPEVCWRIGWSVAPASLSFAGVARREAL